MKLLLILMSILSWRLLSAQSKPDTIVMDIDHNSYETVRIGTQIWMAENLKTTHYSNGDAIPNITSANEWQNLEMGAWCNFNNDSRNASVYGHLYNWFAVTDSRHLCPAGWHVPSTDEWNTLDSVMGTEASSRLKASSPSWQNSRSSEIDKTGFKALPGGFLDVLDGFTSIGDEARWWTATRVSHVNGKGAYYRYVGNGSKLGKGSFNRVPGCSVRCVKD